MGDFTKINHSAIDALCEFPPRPDPALFPLYQKATPRFVELLPGDCLVVPAFWWHWVFSDQGSISVNHWFDADADTTEPRKEAGKYAHWKAVGTWDLDYLDRNLTEEIYISASVSKAPNLSPVARPRRAYDAKVYLYRTVRFQRFVENVRKFPDAHHVAVVTFKAGIKIFDDITIPDILPDAERRTFGARTRDASTKPLPFYLDNTNLWVNVNEGQSGLHFDEYSSAMIQVCGRKRIALFSPDDSPFLYGESLGVEAGRTDELLPDML